MKLCNDCNINKPLTDFHRHKSSYKSKCKVCRNKSNREWNERVSYKRVRCPDPQRDYGIGTTPKVRASLYKRRVRFATPKWVRVNHSDEMQYLIDLRDEAIMLTGDSYHIDHIIPLKHKSVCGLNVPWNLRVIPSDINLKKGNYYKVDY